MGQAVPYTADQLEPQFQKCLYKGGCDGICLQPDPLPGYLTFPQSLNLYPYVSNNPVNWKDPLGLVAGRQCYWEDCNQAEVFQCSRQCESIGKKYESCKVRISYYESIRNGQPTLIQKRGDISCSCKDDDECKSSPDSGSSPDTSPSGASPNPGSGTQMWWGIIPVPLLPGGGGGGSQVPGMPGRPVYMP